MSTVAPGTATTASNGTGRVDSAERVEQFKGEVAKLQLSDPATSRERALLSLGSAAMVLGVVLAVVAYFGSHGTTNALSQRDFIIVALIGVTCAIVGGALFLRYSMAAFLRFWMARMLFEIGSQVDRVVPPSNDRV